MRTPRRVIGWSILPLFLASPLAAQTPDQGSADPAIVEYADETAGQEGAVYGRLRYLEGAVTLRRDSVERSDLVINDPVLPGDVLTTLAEGRCEIQLADGSVLKLDNGTEVVLQSLSDSANQLENTTILQLGAGAIIIRAERMDTNQKRFQIDTDSASIFLLSEGIFRIDAIPGRSTAVLSRRGVAEVMAQDVSTMVRSGERITARPGQIPGEPQVFNTRLYNEFDAWSSQRDDALLRRTRVDEQVPPGLPEPVEPYATELSYYGHWYNNPTYGWVWRPVGLAGGWQPYMDGRWVASPTGLVWVSYEPWGWAPFHYGRWEFLLGSGWVWIPGHVFSGAYVAWSVAPGYFGWCPLGYYNYPIAIQFNFGHHYDPWVYVPAGHIYDRTVRRVIVRDVTVVRDIERKKVVLRAIPVIDPGKVQAAPRVAEEVYRGAAGRRDLQLVEDPGGRKMPFHEQERQRLVRMNNTRTHGNDRPAFTVGRGVTGRSVSVVPTGREVMVPQRKSPLAATPASPRYERPAPRGAGSVDGPSKGVVTSPGPVIGTTRRPAGKSPGPAKAPPELRRESSPEQVIPRIMPRPRPTAGTTSNPPRQVIRRPLEPPSQGRQPQARPAPPQNRGRQAQPSRPSSPPQGNKGGSEQKQKGADKGGNKHGSRN